MNFDSTNLNEQVIIPTIELSKFLGEIEFKKFWNYQGSLTYPPCTEGIMWTIVRKAQPITDIQLISFTQFFANNPSFANGDGNNRAI